MSERKAKYQTKNKPTKADELLAITLTRGDWARVAVALGFLSKKGGLGKDLALQHRRLSDVITQELSDVITQELRGDEQD